MYRQRKRGRSGRSPAGARTCTRSGGVLPKSQPLLFGPVGVEPAHDLRPSDGADAAYPHRSAPPTTRRAFRPSRSCPVRTTTPPPIPGRPPRRRRLISRPTSALGKWCQYSKVTSRPRTAWFLCRFPLKIHTGCRRAPGTFWGTKVLDGACRGSSKRSFDVTFHLRNSGGHALHKPLPELTRCKVQSARPGSGRVHEEGKNETSQQGWSEEQYRHHITCMSVCGERERRVHRHHE